MGQLYADTFPRAFEIPTDAVVILCWDEDPAPAHWTFVAFGSGYASLAAIGADLKDQFPQLNGKAVLATRVGGNIASGAVGSPYARTKIFAITEQVTRSLSETDPPTP